MKVLVLGAGVIGITTAYYLADAGYEVEVLDRNDQVAEGTSFANAGQVSPGYSSPWAGPGMPLKALKWLAMRHGPLVLRPRADPAMWSWLFSMLRNCTSARYALNKSRMVPLAEYSRDCLRNLRADTGIEYDEGSLGTLQLFRTQQQMDAVGKDVEVLRRFGVAYEALAPKGCIDAEPGLARARASFAGGLRLPGDETGDCRLFCERLAALARLKGVRFSFDTSVSALLTNGSGIEAVQTTRGRRKADSYVIALGCETPSLLSPMGIRIPVYPVKGYSITMPIADDAAAPVSTVMDETFKTAITRLGDRIRVGGTAEIGGFDLRLRTDRKEALLHSYSDFFREGGDAGQVSFWSGLRPMTPDGPPLVCATPVKGLYLNTGHGTLGWTMACGSGKLVSDLVGGKSTDIDASTLGIGRYAQ